MELTPLKVGIVGAGGIGLAYAAWIADRGHEVSIWSPQRGAEAPADNTLTANGVLEGSWQVAYAKDAQSLATSVQIIVIAVPLNGHRSVMDSLLPHLRSGQLIIVSSIASLSSLYLYEAACRRGIALHVELRHHRLDGAAQAPDRGEHHDQAAVPWRVMPAVHEHAATAGCLRGLVWQYVQRRRQPARLDAGHPKIRAAGARQRRQAGPPS